MNAVEAGDALTRMVHSTTDHRGSLILGMVLVFEFPEYARALYDAAASNDESDGFAARRDVSAYMREWIAAHPIEVVA